MHYILKNKIMQGNISGRCLMLLLLITGWADMRAQTSESASLKVGDAAPPLVVRKWIKGNPLTTFIPGKVYVVEFWAIWCGPCQAAMPHLSELARKYKDKAEVISFDVKEDKKTDFLPKVERFVKWSGDRMDYSVAIDATDDIMEKTWLQAAGANGIPHLFIIDKQGKIAWHGHPNFVDDVLAAVVNGEYDEAGRKRIEEQIKAKDQLYDSLAHKMMAVKMKKDYQTALALVEEMFPIFPGMRDYCQNMKYEFLSHVDSAKARLYGERIVAQCHPKDKVGFATLILFAQPNGSFNPDYGFALKAIKEAAADWEPQDKGIFSTLALAYYKAGNKQEALKHQKKFIELLKKNPSTKPKALESAEKALVQYKS
jgi:thiol-disulfide isomerase/thioredoxin